jgi:type III pantothenate kinase
LQPERLHSKPEPEHKPDTSTDNQYHQIQRLTVLLILDIGNSSIKGGFFDNGMLARSFRIKSDPGASIPAYRHALRDRLSSIVPDRVGILSVVPRLTTVLSEVVGRELMLIPEVLHTNMQLPIEMGYRSPESLGIDRLAAACAGWKLFARDERDRERSVVVVDAGTAVTVDAVDASGTFRGGAIAPGPEIMRMGLSRGTAQLIHVPLEIPRRAIGRSTRESLQSGVMFGFVDQVSGLIDRIKRQVKRKPFVVATGGWAPLLNDHIASIDRVEDGLVLFGGRLLLDLNPQDKEA